MEIDEWRLLSLAKEKSIARTISSFQQSHPSQKQYSLCFLRKGLLSCPIVTPRSEAEA